MDFQTPQSESERTAEVSPERRVERSDPMSFDSWAAQPAPKRRTAIGNKDGVDIDALKIFLILAGLTAGMALGLRLLF